ncbi:MAG TPA: family 78 glycoside hydrolase catalytic domain [Terracidiphilus sp.]
MPSAARIAIFADSRYQLFVNGVLVGRGPARAPLYWGYYDSFSVRKLLHAGKNVIAVEVRWFGDSMAWYREPPGAPEHGGLLCQLDYFARSGHHVVASDASWKTSEDESELWGEPRINGALPEVEVVRADLGNPDWTGPDFDDSHWFRAHLTTTQFGLSGPPAEPFSNLELRPMAYPIERWIAPKTLVASGLTTGAKRTGLTGLRSGTAPIGSSVMADLGHVISTEPHDSAAHILRNGTDLLGRPSRGTATILPHAAPAYVILDMGKEVDGYPRLTLEAPKGTVVDLGWSERLTNGRVDADEPGGNYVARYYAREGLQHWTLWGWHGFRYVELRFSPSSVPVKFRLDVLFSTADLMHAGSLQTSNPELNELWRMGAYTWQLSALDSPMDTPTREQREWVGDGQLEMLVNSVADGNLDIFRKFLLDTARDQRQDGAIPSVVASGVSDTWVIDDYMLSFVDAAHEYYSETGDRPFLSSIYPNVVRTMQWFHRLQQPDGYLGKMPYWVFLDWSMPDTHGESAILNALYMHALENAADLAIIVGDRVSASEFKRRASVIRRGWNERYWNARRGLYVDAIANGKQSSHTGQLVNADAVLFGLAPKQRVASILARITNPALVKAQSLDSTTLKLVEPDGPIDYDRDIVQAQPYGMYFVLAALAKSGWGATAIQEIERFWGPMRAVGNGTFWEQFKQANGTSCHAWSATPTYILSRMLLGVDSTTPGFKTLTVAPHPSGLLWAKGAVPTARGTVRVAWKMRHGSSPAFDLQLDLPFNAQTRVVLPKWQGHAPRREIVDGRSVLGPVVIEHAGKHDVHADY